MSLPTPPGTSHRDKENRLPRSGSSSRVAWAQLNKYHNLASPPRKRLRASASTELPARSILKRPSAPVTAVPAEPERETTPEPSDPLANLQYLEWPVSQIIAPDASLRNLIEAYSVLAARLRSSVQENADADCSWPLFQPLRKHREALVDVMCRDLGRALVDPLAGAAAEDTGPESPVEPEARTVLPSPQKSPRKKRGMSAEQVKYARDLCTTTHSVIKLLAFVFTSPALHHVFNDRDLGSLLTHVLAIPLAPSLPTPNARKTCALAIWLIQSQRLPVSVLLPAKDRIAYALGRAIDGELGKEGKKGSASDGLRAIHELSLYEPAVFVPAFAALFPSVLDNLLAVTLSLRTQACHALNGFALASTRIQESLVHSHIAECVAVFLTEAPGQQSPRKKASPGQATASVDPVIVRTLRTTLNAQDPPAAAHGPVWALSVMADFIILLGSALTTSKKLQCILSNLLSLSMRHKKSSVRGIACLLWRCIGWTYFRPPLPPLPSGNDGESDMGVGECPMMTPDEERRHKDFWGVVKHVVEMGAGVGTIGAVLAYRVDDDEDVKKVMDVVKTMAQKGTYMSAEAISIIARFVSLDEAPEWDWNKLLPEGLFCSYPGLLTTEFAGLSMVVRPIIDATPSVADVRPLTKAELAGDGVIEGLLKVWKEGLHHLSLESDAALPEEFIDGWKGLLTANVEILQDAENGDALAAFAEQVATILGGILGDSKVVFVPPSRRHGSDISLGVSSPVKGKRDGRSNAALKLSVTRQLWDVARKIIPEDDLALAAELLLTYLMENEHDLVWETDSTHDARRQWVFLCTELLVRCRETTTKIFWGAKHPSSAMKWQWDWSVEVRSYIWRTFVIRWKEVAPSKWEGALSLLGVPFADRDGWEMSAEDLETWEATLQFAINQSLDEGIETLRVIDYVAGIISSTHIPTSTSSTRVADLLVSSVEISEATDVPGTLLEFVNDTLVSTYPPEPRNLNASRWLLRNLTQLVDKCPTEMLRCVLEIIQDGLATWISDEYRIFNQDDYDVDVVPLYENVAVCSRSIVSVDTIIVLAPIFRAGFVGRNDKPPSIANAFNDFWRSAVAQVSPPTDGWPEDLLVCLPVEQVIPVVFESDTEDATIPEVQSSPLIADQKDTFGGILRPAFDFDASPLSRATAVEETEGPPSSPPAEAYVDVQMLSTPKKASSPSSSSPPHRPFKSAGSAKFGPVLFSPQSPLAPAIFQRVRSPVTPKRSTRSPRSPEDMTVSPDKENASPRRPLVSVMERIAMQSSPTVSVLGKRSQAEPASEQRPAKRERIVPPPMQPVDPSSSHDVARHAPQIGLKNAVVGNLESEADCMQVEQTLFAFPASAQPSPPAQVTETEVAAAGPLRRSVSPCPSPRPSARKRKLGVFLDAIEVPLLKDVRRLERRQNSASNASSSSRRPLTRSVRKSQSMNFPLQSGLPPPTRKRSQSRSRPQMRSSSPLRGLEDPQLIRSDDSISLARTAPTTREPTLPSSDDDPHQGQVTPHHLISPAMHRTMDLSSDPPSDDSNVSVSPSIQRVARRISRSSSASFASSPLRLPFRLATASPSA